MTRVNTNNFRTWKNITVVVLGTIFLAILFILLNKIQFDVCTPFFNFDNYIPHLIGISYALCVGCASIDIIRRESMGCLQETRKLYVIKGDGDHEDPPMYLLGNILGIVERVAYISAFLIEQPEFIAVWLAVKITMSFKRFEETFYGREMLNSFILNSLLSLAYAFVGWKLIELCYSPDYKNAILLMVILPLFCFVLWGLVYKNIRDWKISPEYNSKVNEKTGNNNTPQRLGQL